LEPANHFFGSSGGEDRRLGLDKTPCSFNLAQNSGLGMGIAKSWIGRADAGSVNLDWDIKGAYQKTGIFREPGMP
jgi:hypothetical protein